MSNDKEGMMFHAHVSKGKVSVMLWVRGTNALHTTIDFSDTEALQLARELTETVQKLPRVGTPADLGCEVL